MIGRLFRWLFPPRTPTSYRVTWITRSKRHPARKGIWVAYINPGEKKRPPKLPGVEFLPDPIVEPVYGEDDYTC